MKKAPSPALLFTDSATRRNLNRFGRLVAVVAALSVPLSQSAQAATYTYSNTTSNTLGTATSWSAGTNWDATPVSASTTSLVFGGTLAAAATIFSNDDIAGNFQLNALSFTAAGPTTGTAPVETITGNTLQFVSNGGTAPTLTINSTGTVKPTLTINNALQLDNDLTVAATTNGTLAGAIGGTAGFIKSGAGTVTFGSTNTYGGATTVSAGILALNTTTQTFNGFTLAGSGALTGATGSVLNLNGNITFDGSANVAAGNGGNNFTVVTLNLNGSRTFNIGDSTASSQDLRINSLIANGTGGANSIEKTGAGTLNLNSATSTYSGGTKITTGVVIWGMASTATGAGAVTKGPLGTGAVTLNGGTLQASNNSFYNNIVANASTSSTIDLAGGGSPALNGNLSGSGTVTFTNTGSNGSFNIGGGNAVDYSGFTGTLILKKGPNTTNLLFNQAGGTLDLSNATVSFDNSANSTGSVFLANKDASQIVKVGALSSSNGFIGTGQFAGARLLVGFLNTNTTFSGSIGGATSSGLGNLEKVGTGTLTLTAAGTATTTTTNSNSFTGSTLIGTAAAGAANQTSATANGGTLEAAGNGGLGSGTAGTSGITVNNGGTLLLSGATTIGTTAPGGVFDRVKNTAAISLGTATGTGVGGTIALSHTGAATVVEGFGRSTTNNGTSSSASTYATTAANSAAGLGALTLTSNSTIDFGTGGKGTLVFASLTTGGFTLNISNYTNTTTDGLNLSGVDGTDDRLIFMSDPSGVLGQISFGAGKTTSEINLGTGNGFEVVGLSSVPEPSTVFAALLLVALVGCRERRRLKGLAGSLLMA